MEQRIPPNVTTQRYGVLAAPRHNIVMTMIKTGTSRRRSNRRTGTGMGMGVPQR